MLVEAARTGKLAAFSLFAVRFALWPSAPRVCNFYTPSLGLVSRLHLALLDAFDGSPLSLPLLLLTSTATHIALPPTLTRALC